MVSEMVYVTLTWLISSILGVEVPFRNRESEPAGYQDFSVRFRTSSIPERTQMAMLCRTGRVRHARLLSPTVGGGVAQLPRIIDIPLVYISSTSSYEYEWTCRRISVSSHI